MLPNNVFWGTIIKELSSDTEFVTLTPFICASREDKLWLDILP